MFNNKTGYAARLALGSLEGIAMAIESYTTISSVSSVLTQEHMEYLVNTCYHIYDNLGKDDPKFKKIFYIIAACKLSCSNLNILNGTDTELDHWFSGVNIFSSW